MKMQLYFITTRHHTTERWGGKTLLMKPLSCNGFKRTDKRPTQVTSSENVLDIILTTHIIHCTNKTLSDAEQGASRRRDAGSPPCSIACFLFLPHWLTGPDVGRLGLTRDPGCRRHQSSHRRNGGRGRKKRGREENWRKKTRRSTSTLTHVFIPSILTLTAGKEEGEGGRNPHFRIGILAVISVSATLVIGVNH